MSKENFKNWYFCLNENTINRPQHDWKNMIRVAVKSAKKHTHLVPHFIYDGCPSEFTEELESLGVNIIYHRSVLYDNLYRKFKDNESLLNIGSGAFLRFDIPLYCNDPFAIYTDCDVIFNDEFDSNDDILSQIIFFMGAPQFQINDYQNDLNSGVLIFNIENMKKCYFPLIDYCRNHINAECQDWDQYVYRTFFYNKYQYLNTNYNWKPYWGINEDASLIHWHGPKPSAIEERIETDTPFENENWEKLYQLGKDSYQHYLDLYRSFL